MGSGCVGVADGGAAVADAVGLVAGGVDEDAFAVAGGEPVAPGLGEVAGLADGLGVAVGCVVADADGDFGAAVAVGVRPPPAGTSSPPRPSAKKAKAASAARATSEPAMIAKRRRPPPPARSPVSVAASPSAVTADPHDSQNAVPGERGAPQREQTEG